MPHKPVFAAHTPPQERPDNWHLLREHLSDVADGAKKLAEKFGARELGYYAGLWHDLGKYNPDFQQYLEQCHEASVSNSQKKVRGPRHAIYGAILAAQVCRPLALLIYGHHAGLQGFSFIKNELSPSNPVWKDSYQKVFESAKQDLEGLVPDIDWHISLKNVPQDRLSSEVFLRMLFSCLVDADYLDTEEHFEGKSREKPETSIGNLWSTFEQSRQNFLDSISDRTTLVNQIREQVYQACFSAAEQKPGVFRLSVPTGGGKTLSGLGFALRHAMQNHYERVIVAIPYTSIIEQTVKVYRDIWLF